MTLASAPSVPPGTRAVLLLSGGLDSATVLAWATRAGYAVYAISFRYGQRHQLELERARALAAHFHVAQHVECDIDLRQFGGSALTDDIAVPKDRDAQAMTTGIPVTYVPARNTIFLSFAMAWAEVLGAEDVFIGVNALDYSGYPDCRPAFIEAFERLANLATRAGVEGTTRLTVHTPLMEMTKKEIIQTGLWLGVDYGMTTSCYDPSAEGAACGHCDACQLRRRGFEQAGLTDPARYQTAD
ncbi:MAG: 7-cyano-7-deazaguanine synthase QueC [Gemmatimonadaceae bacterium]|nr:7-cyano-7-deazaguanine synthase QueC [Gemmatimonadaceae bacterium]